jgi:hypothetical protein
MREIAEETGIQGKVLAELGSIDYWFVTEGRRVHKTVHHYLLRSVGGELSDADIEVTEVAWVPLPELQSRLAYADERRLAAVAGQLIERMESQDLPVVTNSDRGAQPLDHPRPRRAERPERGEQRRPRPPRADPAARASGDPGTEQPGKRSRRKNPSNRTSERTHPRIDTATGPG